MNITLNQENDLEIPVAPPIILPHSYSMPHILITPPPIRKSVSTKESAISPFYKSDFNVSNSCLTLTFSSNTDLEGEESLQVLFLLVMCINRMI